MEGQDSWERRQIIEIVRLHGLALAASISQFDQLARGKLSVLASKVAKLERNVEYYEAATCATSGRREGGER